MTLTPQLPISCLAFMALLAQMPCLADEPNKDKVLIGNFSASDMDEWIEKSFVGQTEYTLVQTGQNTILQATTNKSASILYRKIDLNLRKTPWLNWSWKISDTYGDIDEKSREGDDYPARIYVVIKTGLFPWNTFALNYVWSSSSPVGESWKNAYSGNARMIALQTGNKLSGRWVTERHNVLLDIQRYIDEDISTIAGVAIMVDGDDTGMQTTSWFGDIYFSAE